MTVHGFFDDRSPDRLGHCGSMRRLGAMPEIFEAVQRKQVDAIFVALPMRQLQRVMDLVQDVWAGRKRLIDIEHPELAMVQDIAVQAGQGRIAERSRERLGRSDAGIILWRKILGRELSAIVEGRPGKKWKTAPADVLPIIGV
jgi:hypothetical protein